MTKDYETRETFMLKTLGNLFLCIGIILLLTGYVMTIISTFEGQQSLKDMNECVQNNTGCDIIECISMVDNLDEDIRQEALMHSINCRVKYIEMGIE